MAKNKLQDCRRCDSPFIELGADRERRRFLDAAPLCEECQEEFKQVKIVRGLGPLYYIGNTEPMMF